MRVLALDLGGEVGLCWGGKRLSSRTLSKSLGACLSGFDALLRGAIAEFEPDALWCEKPFIPTMRHAHANTVVQRLYGQYGAVLRIRHDMHLRGGVVLPSSARKAVLGSGKASEADILKACRAAGLDPANPHEADAWVVWKYATA